MSSMQRIAQDAERVVALKRATLEGDEAAALALAKQLFETNPDWILKGACQDELEVRRAAHEVMDELLRGVIFADGGGGTLWRELSLPARGIFGAPILISNARWLRAFGSKLPDLGLEQLDPEQLARMGFEAQARALGRYCAVNDGVRALDYPAVREALDPRLRPALGHWAVAVCLASPGNLGDPHVAARQAQLAKDFVGLHANNTRELAGSTMISNMPFALSYRGDIEVDQLARILNGQLTARMVKEFGSDQPDPSDGQLAEQLVPGGQTVLCPNWRDSHVAYRCCSDAVAGVATDSLRVLMVHEHGLTAQPAVDWQDHTINLSLPGRGHFVQELGGLARQVQAARQELIFYPEVTPNNVTAWLATQRLARVQAAGYGYPVTTGSAQMDYFIGGTEVEHDGAEYCEQLVLLPGLGVSTTAPPEPTRPRTRGFDEPELKLATVTTWQKLNPALVSAWEAILGDQAHCSLELFSAMTSGQAASVLAELSRGFHAARVDLQLMVPRETVLNSLEDADLYLDSFPYGGFNSLVEVLCSGCPVVTLEGRQARHRFGAAMLRRLGMPELLIAKSPEEYIRTARRLLNDAGLRLELRARLGSREEVLARLVDPDIGAHFAAAVEWMRRQGPRKGRPAAPVVIEANTAPLPLTA